MFFTIDSGSAVKQTSISRLSAMLCHLRFLCRFIAVATLELFIRIALMLPLFARNWPLDAIVYTRTVIRIILSLKPALITMLNYFSYPGQLVLLLFAGYVNDQQLKVIEYLQAETRLLKQQLGGRRIRFSNDERRLLTVKGKALGRKLLAEIATIVAPNTILRWYRKLVATRWDYSEGRNRVGKPPKAEEIEKLVAQLAGANPSWGYQHLQGAMTNMGYEISSSTVRNLLKRSGIEPVLKRPTRWRDFLTHAPRFIGCS